MVCDEEAYKLTVEEDGSVLACEIPQLKSDQEETDTRIVLYCNYAAEERFKYARHRHILHPTLLCP